MTNGLAYTNVTWTITVRNVNDPPVFSQTLYEVTVLELSPFSNSTNSVPILRITVTDPDSDTPDTAFHLANVTATCMYFGSVVVVLFVCYKL